MLKLPDICQQQKFFAIVISLLIVVIIGYQLALFTWLLFPSPMQTLKFPALDITPTTSNSKQSIIDPILIVELFGKIKDNNDKTQPVFQDAPLTMLNLVLKGLMVSQFPERSLAIIENQNKQDTYHEGDIIKSSNAKIKAILVDRVILLHQGRSEALLLDKEQKTTTGSTQKPKSQQSAPLMATIKLLQKDPSKLSEYFVISPIKQDGQLTGYLVKPGVNAAFFGKTAFQASDIAIAFNGIDLTDQSKAMQAIQEISKSTAATITVKRNGQLHEIYIN